MHVNGRHYRTIWPADGATPGTLADVTIIDQTKLPHAFETATLKTADDAADAILTMRVRGAPCIGATAAYGMALAMRADPSDAHLERASEHLVMQRPTAVNLRWAIDEMRRVLRPLPPGERAPAAYRHAAKICDDDVETCRLIGLHGLELITDIAAGKPDGAPVNILTHCNAGWIATVDWGTATSPIYQAHDAGVPVHV
ncbi:MAG: S-methyl-5-thioribose-1-phosphate isomerase, partial [Pseudomonadota bacterium]